MAQILHDYHMAQGMAENAPREDGETMDAVLYEYQQAVFRKYDITEEDFERSMAFYCSDMTRLTHIYDKVTKRLEREAELYGIEAADVQHDAYADLTEQGDTANVWADRELIALKPNILENFYSFSIVADSTWYEGDDILWRLQATQLARAGMGLTHIDLVVTYTNDSVRSTITHHTSSPLIEMRIFSPAGWLPRKITGHAFMPLNADADNYRLLLLHHPILVRTHKPEATRSANATDSLATDSTAIDSLATDSIRTDSTDGRRLSPTEFLKQQDVERTINVTKEQPFDPRSRQRGYQQRRRRRR